jgi:hypothetical protein
MKKIVATFLLISIFFSAQPFVLKAHAYWGVQDSVSDFSTESSTEEDFLANSAGWAATVAKWASDNAETITVVAIKLSTLAAIQQLTVMFEGSGTAQQSIVRDYNDYLYGAPSRAAMTQMNSFFNSASQGRLSSLNYQGVGPNYDSYLATQARSSITGTPFTTNLQNQVTDPSKLFAQGNMKGWMSFFQCANNVFCYSLTAQSQYNQTFKQAQTVAKYQQVNGFLPTIKNGRITSPASLAENALMLVDKVGTNMVVSAPLEYEAGITQIIGGAAITLTGRLINYAIADDKTKASLAAQNSSSSLSSSYSSQLANQAITGQVGGQASQQPIVANPSSSPDGAVF